MNYKECIQHCRALLSHHSFARNAFEFSSKSPSSGPVSENDPSSPFFILDEEILENYMKKSSVDSTYLLKLKNEEMIVFIQETFYGCIRFQKLLYVHLEIMNALGDAQYFL